MQYRYIDSCGNPLSMFDRVILIYDDQYHAGSDSGPRINMKGTIKHLVPEDNSVLVEFDDAFYGGHNGYSNDIKCEHGHGWFLEAAKLKLVDDQPEMPDVSKDDIMVFINEIV